MSIIKYVRWIVCCYVLLICLSTTNAQAGAVATYPLPVLVAQSDAICVGRAGMITLGKRMEVGIGGVDDRGNEIRIPAQEAIADFEVDAVLKGNVKSGNIMVSFAKNIVDPSTAPYYCEFTELIAGQRVMVFLKASTGAAPMALLHPEEYPTDVIPVGNASATVTDSSLTPIRKVLLYLAAALSDPNKEVRSIGLTRLSEMAYFLYWQPQSVPDNILKVGGNPALRDQLQEPGTGLEAFMEQRIVPSIEHLWTDSDPDLRRQAIIVAGSLQDVKAIPLLAADAQSSNADKDGEDAYVIKNFRVPSAVRFLVPLLKDKSAVILAGCTFSLECIDDPHAIPFLLDQLGEPDHDAARSILAALDFLTRHVGGPTSDDYWPPEDVSPAKEAQLVAFWKQWALDNAAKVQTLRAEFEKSLSQPVAPPSDSLSAPADLKPAANR